MIDKFNLKNRTSNRLDSNRKIEKLLKQFRVQLILRGKVKIFARGNIFFKRGKFSSRFVLHFAHTESFIRRR